MGSALKVDRYSVECIIYVLTFTAMLGSLIISKRLRDISHRKHCEYVCLNTSREEVEIQMQRRRPYISQLCQQSVHQRHHNRSGQNVREKTERK